MNTWMQGNTILTSMLMVLGGTASTPALASETDFFEKEIRPLLVKNCYRCHAEEKDRGGLRLDSKSGWQRGGDSGAALKPGDPEGSLLIRAVRYQDPDLRMPPSGRLHDAEIAALVRWVKMGAVDPRAETRIADDKKSAAWGREHWAFQPLKRSPLPNVNSNWPRSDIDRFVLARLQQEQLQPVADAEPLALLRRLHFDLTGLPPEPREIASFLQTPPGQGSIELLVDRLLASPHFGEHWGRHWLDLARFAETSGATNDLFLPDAWRYRDYVIKAFNEDRPYNQFLTEQIAGDLLPHASPAQRDEQTIATGFLALGIYDYDKDDAQIRLDQIDEQIDVTTRAILGLTVSCARCHDHKYDPIPTAEYYALAGIFSSTQICKTGVYTRGKHTLVRVSTGAPLQGYQQEPVDAFTRLQHELYAGRNPVVHMGWEHNKLLAAAKRATSPAEAARLQTAAANLKRTMDERVAASARAARALRQLPPLPPMALAVRDSARPHDQAVRIRGEVDKLGPVVPRGFLSVLPTGATPRIDQKQSGRRELAAWLTARDNPLTARVIVNRVWGHLFGAGLVSTVDNFGVNGATPSHPKLLDHLALQFMDDGWSIKRLIRRIVLSRVYRLSVAGNTAAESSDGDNRLLWRMNRRRLQAESLRDAILAFSGQLERTPGQRSLIAEHGPGSMRFDKEKIHYDSRKRSIYLPQPRGKGAEIIMQFDGADSNAPIGQRDVTTVPLQALFLLNSPWIRDQSRLAAEHLLAQEELGQDGRIDLAFRLALARPATVSDLQTARMLLSQYRSIPELTAWSGLCQVLIASSEFRYLH